MKTIKAHALLLVLTLAVVLLVSPHNAQSAATIIINNLDGPGEGFNDPTAAAPVGGNPGATLGAQRLFAFQFAANLVGQCVNSTVTIVVDANMDPMFCNATSAVLGGAGATTVHRDFVGALIAATWYPQALANALAGVDLSAPNSDIGATFNSNINGNPACLGGLTWYYGVDGLTPGGTIDFVTVILHEVIHGLGFQTFQSSAGALFLGFNDTYERNMVHVGAVPSSYPLMTNGQRAAGNIGDPNLAWGGAQVTTDFPLIPLSAGTSGGLARLYAPNPFQGGSSLSHWSTAVTPNENMEPFITGTDHTPGLALALLKDIGWTLDPKLPVAVAITAFDARATDGGVELRAEFVSSYEAIGVNVYRADRPGDWKLLEGVPGNGSGDFTYLDHTARGGETYSYKIGVTDQDGEFFSAERKVSLPSETAELGQNVPNPFNPATSIRFVLSEQQAVRLSVYDAAGRLVKTLVNDVRANGPHTVEWNGTNNVGNAVGSGVYFYRLEAGAFIQTRKMVLLK